MPKEIKGLTFKPIESKRTRSSYKPRRLSKLIYAVCVKDTDDFRAHIVVTGTHRSILSVPFDLESRSLKGKEKVFSKSIDKQTKKHICFIRTPWEALMSGKTSRTLTPFCEGWVYSGYLVRIGKSNYFQIKEAIFHKDFVKENIAVKEEELKL